MQLIVRYLRRVQRDLSGSNRASPSVRFSRPPPAFASSQQGVNLVSLSPDYLNDLQGRERDDDSSPNSNSNCNSNASGISMAACV